MEALLLHRPGLALVLITAVVLAGGATCNLLAARLRIPAIVPLLAFGAILGPDGLGVILPGAFGAGLRAIVSLAVAVIVFEGALLIDVRHLRHCSRAVVGLLTVGVGTTFLAAGTLAHYVMAMPWKVALLFGAIVCVTGPTVISPILKRLPVARHVKTTLEAEGVFADAIGVLLTAALFSFITGSAGGLAGGVAQLGTNLAIGSLMGLLTALALHGTLRLAGSANPDLARLAALGIVVLGYACSQALAHESGIAAAAVAGLLAGATRLPHEDAIREFKGDLTLVALSLVFVLLAASMRVAEVAALGLRGLVVVIALMVVVRPAAVALATWGSSLSWRERAFVAWMGPRGIVAASLATLMGLELQAWKIQSSADLAPLTFLTVVVTVLIEGGLAGRVARWLGVVRHQVLVAGGDDLGRGLAAHLADDGEPVTVMATSREERARAWAAGLDATLAERLDESTLARAGLPWAHTVAATTPLDAVNLAICEMARAARPTARLIARVGDPANEPGFHALGVETIPYADAAALGMALLVGRPNSLPLLGLGPDAGRVVESRVRNAAFDGKALAQLDLPPGCLIVLVKHGADVRIPDGRTVLRLGDTITLLGDRDALELIRHRFEAEV